MNNQPLIFFHNPFSRAAMTRALLEEVGADFEIRPIDFKQDEQHSPEYLAINPMGKVPAILYGNQVVTETVALHIWLSDLYPAARLAPALDDPLRGAYLRWLVFYAACFEPALADRSMQRDPGPRAHSPYGDFDTTMKTITDQIKRGPYLLGERFSAADVLWGNALHWAINFGTIETTPTIEVYVQRITSRPAQVRAMHADGVLATEMGLTG